MTGSLLTIVALSGCGSLRGDRVMVGEDGAAVDVSNPRAVDDLEPVDATDAVAPAALAARAPIVAVQASVATRRCSGSRRSTSTVVRSPVPSSRAGRCS